ncbi:MAG: hypothetical protein ABI887_18520 [Burkholderiales bacterium]
MLSVCHCPLGTTTPANISTNTKTKQVRMASPRSADIPARPSLAITDVKPAKTIEKKAYCTQRSIGGSFVWIGMESIVASRASRAALAAQPLHQRSPMRC